MTGWKSSQRSDSGMTTILASIQVFYSWIQEDGYLTLFYHFREFHSRALGLLNRTNTDNDKSSLEFFIAEVDNCKYPSFHVSRR